MYALDDSRRKKYSKQSFRREKKDELQALRDPMDANTEQSRRRWGLIVAVFNSTSTIIRMKKGNEEKRDRKPHIHIYLVETYPKVFTLLAFTT